MTGCCRSRPLFFFSFCGMSWVFLSVCVLSKSKCKINGNQKIVVERLVQSKNWSEMKTCILWSVGKVLLWSQVLYWSISYHLPDFFVKFLNRKVKRSLSHGRLWSMSKRNFFCHVWSFVEVSLSWCWHCCV